MDTLIYLDYDDTCFPTSWITKNNINLKTMKNIDINMFKSLDTVLYNLFIKLLKIGTVIIITNAMPSWIDITMKVLPKTKTIIKNIKIVSARQRYQKMSSNMSYWKERAFRDEIKTKYNNIISCGDAIYEYYALIKLYDHIKNKKYLKSIRFLYGTHDINIIIDQLNVLSDSIVTISNTKKNLDLVFKI
jgi:hypothetical protein